ncbi:MAG: hypothetical protein V3U28_04805 [Candidatus Acidoferrales bacterium]
MKSKRVISLLGMLALTIGWALAPPLAAQTTPQRWLHVTVDERGEDAETVRINLPLNVVEAILPTIYVDPVRGGKLKLSQLRIQQVDIRALLEAIRNAPDNEFVTVESARETVRIAKEGGYLLVNVDKRNDEGELEEEVDIRIPFAVVDALLSAGEDELDLVAGVRALAAHGERTLVTVNKQDSRVRIWVDSRSTIE